VLKTEPVATVAAVAAAAVATAGADNNQQRGEVSMYTVRVSRIQIGNNLAQIKAMCLANVLTLGSQCLASKQIIEFYLCCI